MQRNSSLSNNKSNSAQIQRQPPRAKVSAECKRRLAVLDKRIALMSDTELFTEAELALRDLGF
ncbi:MAG: hypothetical protein H7Y37_07905 [Anaerolineae bacterium]|nr:hypothetical protein [Gloeobacterales cyanobacterium ES-bin-313]